MPKCTATLPNGKPCPKLSDRRHQRGFKSLHEGPLCHRCYERLRTSSATCKGSGCTASTVGTRAGYCRRHEHLPLRALSPDQLADVRGRIVSAITPDRKTGCWNFSGHVLEDGYSRFNLPYGLGTWLGHRLSYHLFFDGHANGAQLDHLCSGLTGGMSARCISPFHLNPATPKANTVLRDLRAENPAFPFHVGRDGQEVDPPPYPFGLILFSQLSGLPMGHPGTMLFEAQKKGIQANSK